MDLCDLSCILPLMERHGFRFSKSLGQNFLTDAAVPPRIAEASGVERRNGVLEIGPGVGCLTRELAERAGRVVSVELDARLIPVLRETVGALENVCVLQGDVMKTDLDTILDEHFSGLVPTVCANLPYNITTPVLTKLLRCGRFETVTVLIQKEVAARLCAGPGAEDYGAFSVFVQFYAIPELCFIVPPGCFTPRPKVTSAVVKLTRRAVPAVSVRDEAMFHKVVRGAFAQRRKTLLNSLQSAFGSLGRDALENCILACGLDPGTRGETLGLPEFAALSDAIGDVL